MSTRPGSMDAGVHMADTLVKVGCLLSIFHRSYHIEADVQVSNKSTYLSA